MFSVNAKTIPFSNHKHSPTKDKTMNPNSKLKCRVNTWLNKVLSEKSEVSLKTWIYIAKNLVIPTSKPPLQISFNLLLSNWLEYQPIKVIWTKRTLLLNPISWVNIKQSLRDYKKKTQSNSISLKSRRKNTTRLRLSWLKHRLRSQCKTK